MDYKNQDGSFGDSGQAFFTAGVGNTSSSENSFEPENNLDLTNDAASWGTNSMEHTRRAIGNQAISSMGEADAPFGEAGPSDEMGKVIDIDLPPTAQPEAPEPSNVVPFDSHRIRTKGDHIDRGALVEINHVIREFNQTNNAADFYTEVRGSKDQPGMLDSNLENSYGRVFGAGLTSSDQFKTHKNRELAA